MSSSQPPIAALFPGQGSQYPGMAKMLRDEFPWIKEIFEEASDAIKEDVLRLCLDGSAEELQLTENAQPCILVTSCAWFQVLKRTFDFRPAAGAGHSLGEYSALVSSRVLSLSDATRLVRTRGQLMQTAVAPGKGKMVAMIGLSDEIVNRICEAATESEDSLVSPANFNAPNQVVLAGHTAAVERAEKLAADPKRPDWKARKVIPLKVSAPFHCALMSGVASTFEAHLHSAKWETPTFPVANNLDAQIRAGGDLVPVLRDQIDHPVQWTNCVRNLHSKGFRTFIEMGPGKVLGGLVKRIIDDGRVFGLDSLEDLKNLETQFKENFR